VEWQLKDTLFALEVVHDTEMATFSGCQDTTRLPSQQSRIPSAPPLSASTTRRRTESVAQVETTTTVYEVPEMRLPRPPREGRGYQGQDRSQDVGG
jgi:hypothetical protein